LSAVASTNGQLGTRKVDKTCACDDRMPYLNPSCCPPFCQKACLARKIILAGWRVCKLHTRNLCSHHSWHSTGRLSRFFLPDLKKQSKSRHYRICHSLLHHSNSNYGLGVHPMHVRVRLSRPFEEDVGPKLSAAKCTESQSSLFTTVKRFSLLYALHLLKQSSGDVEVVDFCLEPSRK
jgi:hypothetical protein